MKTTYEQRATTGGYARLWGVLLLLALTGIAEAEPPAWEQHQWLFVDDNGVVLDPPGEEQTLTGVRGGDSFHMRLVFTDGGLAAQDATIRLKYYTSFADFDADLPAGYVVPADASWARSYGGPGADTVGGFDQMTASGNGALLAAQSDSFGPDRDLWVLEIDAAGELQWQSLYDGNGPESLSSLARTSDGGFLLASFSGYVGFGGWPDLWLIRTDAARAVQWSKAYGIEVDPPSGLWVSCSEDSPRVTQTQDGGFLVLARTDAFAADLSSCRSELRSYLVLKLDAFGDVEWSKLVSDDPNLAEKDDHDWAAALVETSDGGYLVGGRVYSRKPYPQPSETPYLLVKLDGTGNLVWKRWYGRQGSSGISVGVPGPVRETSDGGFVLTTGWPRVDANGYSEGIDAAVLKLDSTGMIEWQKVYGDSPHYETPRSVRETSDGGFILVGNREEPVQGIYEAWVLKLDGSGGIEWEKGYRRANEGASALDVLQAADGGYLVYGTRFTGPSDPDLWVLKLKPDGTIDGLPATDITTVPYDGDSPAAVPRSLVVDPPTPITVFNEPPAVFPANPTLGQQAPTWAWSASCSPGSWCEHGTRLATSVSGHHQPEPGYAFEADFPGFDWTPVGNKSGCENNLHLTYGGTDGVVQDYWFRYEVDGVTMNASSMHYKASRPAMVRTMP